MKIILSYYFLMYQLLQHCNAAMQCVPKLETEDATIVVQPGSSMVIVYSQTSRSCSNASNDSYILLQEDHHTGVLKEISRQQNHTFQISSIQLNTTGVYCVYKECAPEDMEQCCIRIIVPQEMQMIVPDSAHMNTPGICYVKAWPMLTTDEINVFTDDGCAITKFIVTINSTYTTAILFTLDNVNSSCQRISCLTQFNEEVKHISMTPTPAAVSNISSSMPTGSCKPSSTIGPTSTSSGTAVVSIYRITIWTVVLTLTVLSTAFVLIS